MLTEPYIEQLKVWPEQGRHIVAQFDTETIIVYQAYKPSIAQHVINTGSFGGEFSYNRMSWIKTNFLWMMYRSGWGTKVNQEVTLGLRIRRVFFEKLLAQVVSSSWNREEFATKQEWEQAVSDSSVRLQWDPDHDPSGGKLERRAIQLGLRGEILAQFGQKELLEVIDLSAFVAEQRENLAFNGILALTTPRERVYRPADPSITTRLLLTDWI
ncbi:unnamed protein product [Sphagnum jensenii]|jgi:hypothetical protein|uniref:DUF4291 domain-containing protein n=1 Tax=Sphagnum jensenii TaxID=128206 RepID=A0ABP0VHX9_9BRYO